MNDLLESIRARGYSPRKEEALELAAITGAALLAALFVPIFFVYAVVMTLHSYDMRLARTIQEMFQR